MEYRALSAGEIGAGLFDGFERRQVVTRCWRSERGEWVIRDVAFVERWGEAEYEALTGRLRDTALAGGAVFAALSDGRLLGFASVEPGFFGPRGEYLELACLHVSEDARGRGIGKALFWEAAAWAKARGAEKLFISAHSAVESQAFYQAVGCRDAAERSASHAGREPFDRQLEYRL